MMRIKITTMAKKSGQQKLHIELSGSWARTLSDAKKTTTFVCTSALSCISWDACNLT